MDKNALIVRESLVEDGERRLYKNNIIKQAFGPAEGRQGPREGKNRLVLTNFDQNARGPTDKGRPRKK